MISFGNIIQKKSLDQYETECYIIDLEKIDVKIEKINNNLCITLTSNQEPERLFFNIKK